MIVSADNSPFPTHGQQAFAFFNGHDDTHCHLPLFVLAGVPGEGQEYLISAEMSSSSPSQAIFRELARRLGVESV